MLDCCCCCNDRDPSLPLFLTLTFWYFHGASFCGLRGCKDGHLVSKSAGPKITSLGSLGSSLNSNTKFGWLYGCVLAITLSAVAATFILYTVGNIPFFSFTLFEGSVGIPRFRPMCSGCRGPQHHGIGIFQPPDVVVRGDNDLGKSLFNSVHCNFKECCTEFPSFYHPLHSLLTKYTKPSLSLKELNRKDDIISDKTPSPNSI
jgi:hypothetical protein